MSTQDQVAITVFLQGTHERGTDQPAMTRDIYPRSCGHRLSRRIHIHVLVCGLTYRRSRHGSQVGRHGIIPLVPSTEFLFQNAEAFSSWL